MNFTLTLLLLDFNARRTISSGISFAKEMEIFRFSILTQMSTGHIRSQNKSQKFRKSLTILTANEMCPIVD